MATEWRKRDPGWGVRSGAVFTGHIASAIRRWSTGCAATDAGARSPVRVRRDPHGAADRPLQVRPRRKLTAMAPVRPTGRPPMPSTSGSRCAMASMASPSTRRPTHGGGTWRDNTYPGQTVTCPRRQPPRRSTQRCRARRGPPTVTAGTSHINTDDVPEVWPCGPIEHRLAETDSGRYDLRSAHR